MGKTYKPVYTELEEDHLQRAVDLVRTLRFETQPISGHGDHYAIQDCWNTLFELVSLMAIALQDKFKEKAFADKVGAAVTEILNRDYPGAKPFMHKYETEEKVLQDFRDGRQMLFSFDHGDAEQIKVGGL